MAGDAQDYEIRTEQTFFDGLISALTGHILTIRTVAVTKEKGKGAKAKKPLRQMPAEEDPAE